MNDPLPKEDRYRKITRRQMLQLMGGAGVGVLLTACGGNQAANTSTTQPSSSSTQAGATTNTPATQGGGNTPVASTPASGGAKTTAAASPASTSGTANSASPASGTTQPPMPTVSAQKLKESPQLQEMAKAGKLPKVADRMPKNPVVLEPVEKVGTYGGTWHMGMLGTNDTALLTRTLGYENLVRWQPKTIAFSINEVIPNVAESFEIGKDGAEYTFKLRKGMKWSDGQPFTADDIVFWYEDVFTNKDLTPAVSPYFESGGKPVAVQKVDDHTVVFRFAEPKGLFIQRLATPGGAAPTDYPAHYMKQFHKKYNPKVVQQAKQAKMDNWTDLFSQKADDWGNKDKPVLFAWKITQPLGEGTTQVTAERNPYYWKVDAKGNQLPYIDRLVYDVVQNTNVLVLKALNGEIDMQIRHIASLQNKSIFYKNQKKGNYHFFSTIPSKMNTMLINLNLTSKDKNKRSVFRNKDFRIGLSYAINRQEIIDTVFVSQGEPWQAAPRPKSPLYNEKLAKQYTEHDPEQANKHLDKVLPKKNSQGARLGPDGKPFSFTVEVIANYGPQAAWTDIMQEVKKYWSEVGINIEIKPEDRSLVGTRAAGNLHDAVTYFSDGGLDAVLFPYCYFPSDANARYAVPWGNWYTHGGLEGKVNPKQADFPVEEPPAPAKKQMELYDKVKATADPNEQTRLMKQIIEIAQEQFWIIGISSLVEGFGVVKDDFHNVPKEMLLSWMAPAPAPTHPEQYFNAQ